MHKRINISFLLIVLFSFGLQAQDFPEPTKPKPVPKPRTPKPVVVEKKLASILFRADHDFYLTVDDKKHGDKILANKPENIKLPVGVHKLSFEEADSTGETVERYLRVTSDMAKQKDSVYTVSFKNDFQTIMNAYPATVVTTVSHTASSDQEAQLKAIAKELLDSMIVKQGGSFRTTNRSGGKDGMPQLVTVHSVNVGKYEVTQRQWQAVMGYNNSTAKDCADCPVDNISWNDANAFLGKLNKVSAKKFRLPTEVEWEYIADKSIAAEGGVSSDPDVNRQILKSVVEKSSWYDEKKLHPVGQKEAVAGVFDLFGNVAEWCADDNSKTSSTNGKKVFKGGSYKDNEEALRVSWRNTAAPNDKRTAVGFRLVTDTN